MAETANTDGQSRRLQRFMLLSVAAALVTMAVKGGAAAATGSVGLLSDALESVVNLVAAVVGLAALRTASRPPDEEHPFGHGKAEYLSAAVEGSMILVAAGVIVWTAATRLLDPVPVEAVGLGLVLSILASVVNGAVGATLVSVGRRSRSIAVEADGRHLLTDVWTSVGVILGVALVALTGWDRLDPLIALLVGANIIRTGWHLLRRSGSGLLDAALPAPDIASIGAVLDRHRVDGIDFHAVRTRAAGRQRFVSLHVLVPGAWTVQAAHDRAEQIEGEIAAALPGAITFTHVEPMEDPASYRDELDLDDPTVEELD